MSKQRGQENFEKFVAFCDATELRGDTEKWLNDKGVLNRSAIAKELNIHRKAFTNNAQIIEALSQKDKDWGEVVRQRNIKELEQLNERANKKVMITEQRHSQMQKTIATLERENRALKAQLADVRTARETFLSMQKDFS